MKPETRFGKWLGGVLPPGHLCRVEPPPSPGIPDLNYCIGGVEGWIELKVRPRTKFPFKSKDGKRRPLRVSQRRWIRLRCKNHGRVFVFVAIGSEVYIFTGAVYLDFNENTTLNECWNYSVAVIDRRATAENTKELYKILTGDYREPEGRTSDAPL